MELAVERTWKVSAGEVKLGYMHADTLACIILFEPRSFTSLIII